MEVLQIWVKSMETKQDIRKEIFKRRKEATSSQILTNSTAICERLCSLSEFSEAEWIYLYIDCKNEVMTEGIMKEALRLGKHVAAPRVEGKDMVFYEIHSYDELEPGYFGIMEPKDGLSRVECEDAFLVMPGVAFDSKKHRAGYGGGFYDRYLSVHTGLYKAAVAFDFQIVQQVPTEPTDILPDVVITETTIYY